MMRSPVNEHTLRISSVPNKVRNMLESIALTEPIDLAEEPERTVRVVVRDKGRARRTKIDMIFNGSSAQNIINAAKHELLTTTLGPALSTYLPQVVRFH